MQPQDQNFIQWVTGILIAAAAGTWALLRDIYRRIGDARQDALAATLSLQKQVEADNRDLWDKLNQESEIARVHRETILTRMGDTPTKTDLIAMEKRLTALLSKDQSK